MNGSHQINSLLTIYDTKLLMNNDNNFIGMISELVVYHICLTNSYSTLNKFIFCDPAKFSKDKFDTFREAIDNKVFLKHEQVFPYFVKLYN